jgi:hypothetical protein
MVRLAAALDAPTETAAITVLKSRISCVDLDDPEAVPGWLCDVLDALASSRRIPEWQQLDASGDLTGPLDFFRTLDRILPVEIIDVGDNYTGVARGVGLEAVPTLVGYAYCVRPVMAAG